MGTYEDILLSGDNGPNVVAGDAESILLLTIQGTPILDDNGAEKIGTMPPNKQLKDDILNVFTLWVMNGMPQTSEDAALLLTTPVETPAP